MVVLLCITLIFGYIYEDNDSLLIINDTLTRCGIHQYALKLHLTDNARLFVRSASGAPDTTGWLSLQAPLIVIRDSSSIIGSERGHEGGYLNSHPWGYGPGGGSAGGVSGGGGGGGAYGGNGGTGGDYSGGSGGIEYGTASDTTIEMGSGGGAGRLSVVISNGGSGGASISMAGTCIRIESSSIESNGQSGETGLAGLEASGGGAGGGVRILADTVSIHDASISAYGGTGGDASFGGGGGGSGGRVKIFYAIAIDTTGIALYVTGGNGGQGDPQLPASSSGDSGSVHIGVYTGVDELHARSLSTISIQPNPATNFAEIITERFPARGAIYDVSGRLSMKVTLHKEHAEVDLRTLERGVYFLILENHSCRPYKFVVVR
ncbi:MAG: T9SS type A sorting domain-containing protein [candidate division WOR-3 bacterium]|nr:MAG: T9SS type A sorting domain-containing protein [candidate division WOR-3 bacterium]